MWLGYQKDLLALVADTKEELENTPMMTFTSIVETSDTYVLVNGQYVKESEAATMLIAEPKTASAAFSAVPASAGGGDSNMLATNCITKIPQDINLQLSADGTLTLKSGSKAYDGAGNAVNITSDKTTTTSSNGKQFALLTSSGATLTTIGISSCTSGETDSLAGQQYHLWYDTANKVVNYYGQDGSAVSNTRTLPIALITVSGGKITSIDQVFNGFGYIGSTMFALPGVAVLIPNGRNADGTLNNKAITVSSLRTLSFSTQTQSDFGITTNTLFSSPSAKYDGVSNKNYNPSTGNTLGFCNCGTVETDSTGSITSWTPKTAFHAVDYNEADFVIDSYSDGSGNWYRVYKSGWVEQGGVVSNLGAGALYTIVFLKPYANTQYYANWIHTARNNGHIPRITDRSTTTFNMNLDWFSTEAPVCDRLWYACGIGA